MAFVHCHNHSEYSLLDGASKIKELVQAAVTDEQPALGITDHGSMYGVLDFYKECNKQGIKPIIGNELYQAEESRFSKPNRKGKMNDQGGDGNEKGEQVYYHMIALAETNEGYQNLIQLSSRAFLEGYYYKPRVDWELLEEHSKGLIVTTGCLSGHVLSSLKKGDFAGALEKAGRLQDIFGRDNMFVEIQDHGIPEQKQTYEQLLKIATLLDAPLLATNDSHYVNREDALAHDALLCVQTGALISDEDRFKFDAHEHWIKTSQEMRHIFREHKDACDNTLWIAERADVEIEFGQVTLPDFPIPAGWNSAIDYLRYLAYEGAKSRNVDNVESRKRLDYELGVIENMGFASYFLIVWDLIRHCREEGIRRGPGRGSAAGCMVAFCLDITDINPIQYDLLFERFLNPSRISMPDIDLDFDSRYRDEMIRYTAERYGKDHVAQIVTFSTIKSRAAVRDSARVLGHPYVAGDKIAKAMPPLLAGRETPLEAALSASKPYEYPEGWTKAQGLRDMVRNDPEVKEITDVALGLEGLRRSDGIHAAAVVITKDPLTNYLPIQRKPEGGQDPEEAPIVTQYEMHGVEDLGLLKMDYLGLRNLDVMSMALEQIKANHDVDLDIDNIPMDDEPTFEMLRRGDTIGVFQLEGTAMRELLRRMAPTEFADIAACIALYRPGPMGANMHNDYADRKNGRQAVEAFHPDVEEDLSETYGLMIYQESMMRVAQTLAGYTLAEADNLRKACGKKIRELMQQEREKFVEGCVNTGYDDRLGHYVFDLIEPFSDYAFNKSHAYAYGLISYQTAYLKAHYPEEYLAAILTSYKDKTDKMAPYLSEARKLGLKVAVPNINKSLSDFSVDDNTILFGMSAIKNVGEGVVDKIIAARGNAPFKNFYDFCKRVDPSALNKKALESLINTGAFEAVGAPRKGLYSEFPKIVDDVKKKKKDAEKGVMSLFGDDEIDEVWEIPDQEYDKKEMLGLEKEFLGLYISDHPLSGMEYILEQYCDTKIIDTEEMEDGIIQTFGGVVTNYAPRTTKKGDLMANFVLEDLESSMEIIVFPKTMVEYKEILQEDSVVLVKGRLDKKEDSTKLIMLEMEIFTGVKDNMPLRLKIDKADLSDPFIDSLKDVLRSHKGQSPTFIHTDDKILKLPEEWQVNLSPNLFADLKNLFSKADSK